MILKNQVVRWASKLFLVVGLFGPSQGHATCDAVYAEYLKQSDPLSDPYYLGLGGSLCVMSAVCALCPIPIQLGWPQQVVDAMQAKTKHHADIQRVYSLLLFADSYEAHLSCVQSEKNTPSHEDISKDADACGLGLSGEGRTNSGPRLRRASSSLIHWRKESRLWVEFAEAVNQKLAESDVFPASDLIILKAIKSLNRQKKFCSLPVTHRDPYIGVHTYSQFLNAVSFDLILRAD